jgi:hypothetical protein
MPKEKKINDKRAEQNRIAQNKYRQKQNEKMILMEKRLANVDNLEKSLEIVEQKLNLTIESLNEKESQIVNLQYERQGMIHLMDKLRNEVELLKRENKRLKGGKVPLGLKPRNIKGLSTGYVMQPMCNPRNTPFTSLENTFLPPKKPLEKNSNGIKNAIPNQINPGKVMISKTCLNASEVCDSTIIEKHVPYHLTFSYTDSPGLHSVSKPINNTIQLTSDRIPPATQAPAFRQDETANFLPLLPMQQIGIFHHIPIGSYPVEDDPFSALQFSNQYF